MGRAGLLAGCLALAGCGSGGDNAYAQYFGLVRGAFANTFSNGAIQRDQAAAIPYASIGYRVNDGRQNLLILATDTGGDLLWTSASHVVLVTRDGRVVRTVGLPDNIASVMPSLSAAMTPPAQALKSAFTSIHSADFPDEGRYSVSISCRTVKRGREAITILGKALDTVRAEESCDSGNWSFQNNYWLDAQTGFVWRSVQHLTPKGEMVEIEVLRPQE